MQPQPPSNSLQFGCRLLLTLALVAGVQLSWAQARRDAVVGAPRHLVWFEDVEKAIQAQQTGEVVWALDLTRDRLTDLPEAILQLPNLRYLMVNRNKLNNLPEWLKELTDLRALMADHNHFRHFPDVLLRMPDLEQVSLGENALTAIPLDIDNMENLRVLSLWGNVVAEFPASLANLLSLQVLDLLHNEMTVDEQEMLRTLLPDVKLNFSEPCDCEFDADFSSYPLKQQ